MHLLDSDIVIDFLKKKDPGFSVVSIGERLPDFDLLIASTAITNKSGLITRNTKHFQRIKNLDLVH